jgi:glutaminyl-peptide cyclotransferase
MGAGLTMTLACACTSGSASEPESVGPQAIGDPALAHVKALVGFGPRPAGSEALRKTGDYVVEELKKEKIPVEIDTWQEHGLTYRNLIGRIAAPENAKDAPLILLGTHYDTKRFEGHADPAHNFRFVGANDGGSGTGLLIALAGRIKAMPGRKAEVWLLFFDGEECEHPTDWKAGHPLQGSTRMVKRINSDWNEARKRVRAMVLLDMVGARDLNIDCEENSHAGLRAIVREEATRLGHQRHFAGEAEKHPVEDDHLPFVRTGIPALDLIDLKKRQPDYGKPGDATHWWHTPFDDLSILSARSLQVVGDVVLAILPRLEKFSG